MSLFQTRSPVMLVMSPSLLRNGQTGIHQGFYTYMRNAVSPKDMKGTKHMTDIAYSRVHKIVTAIAGKYYLRPVVPHEIFPGGKSDYTLLAEMVLKALQVPEKEFRDAPRQWPLKSEADAWSTGYNQAIKDILGEPDE